MDMSFKSYECVKYLFSVRAGDPGSGLIGDGSGWCTARSREHCAAVPGMSYYIVMIIRLGEGRKNEKNKTKIKILVTSIRSKYV